ncbi:unnamed protein product [Brassica napus]|uniref:(rape) hypothetical protein n=1 Tax=Brassica napus TaxID=3708 RepID=A0A816KWK1_BRANA|nr:unnamed protein product [Brassica napus]
MYCYCSPTLLTLQFIININRCHKKTLVSLLETISIHLWANIEKFDSLHKPNTNIVGIACEDPEDLVISQSIFSYKLSLKAGTIMTNSQLPLSQLKACRSRTTTVRRLLYFWEAQDVKKVIELMEIDIVLVDEEELLLHCICLFCNCFQNYFCLLTLHCF